MGAPTVEYADPTLVYDMGVQDAVEKMSAAIYPFSVGTELFNKLKNGDAHDFVTKAIGEDKLDSAKRVGKGRLSTVEHDGKQVEILEFLIFPKR